VAPVTRPPREDVRILVWMCVLIGINQLGFGSVVPVLPLYARSFGVSQAAIGLSIAVYGLARFLVAVPAGQLSDRLGRRPALALGGLVTAVGNALCAYAPNYANFVGARFVAGVGAALVLTAGQIVLADITTPAVRGRAMGIYQGSFLFAVGIGPYPGGVLAERFGLPAPFVAFAAAGILAGLVAWFRIPETRAHRSREAQASLPPPPPFAAQLRVLATRIGFLLVSLVSFASAFTRTGALFNVIPVLGQDRLRLTPDRIGFALAVGSLAGFGLTYPAGVLVDRYGRKPVIVPATLLSSASLLLFLLAPSYAWFLAACLIWSVAQGIGGAAPAAYAADVAPPRMNAAAMSLYRTLADAGYVIGPIVLGLVADGFGVETALATGASLLAGVGLLFAWRAPETYRGGAAAPPGVPAS
jgi:DHA1 family multidrug resistance protein-like MFS transporter